MDSLKLSGEFAEIPDEQKSARQVAVEYGIDICQLEYLLTLTPEERPSGPFFAAFLDLYLGTRLLLRPGIPGP